MITAYAALVKARGEAHAAGSRTADERLAQARADAEDCWQQLHAERSAHLSGTGPLEHPRDQGEREQ